MYRSSNIIFRITIVFIFNSFLCNNLLGQHSVDEFNIGWASTDITPDEPVTVAGGSSVRVYDTVNDPITATVLILEAVQNGKHVDMAIMISVDLVVASDYLKEKIIEKIKNENSAINISKVIMNATHSHTAPVTRISPERINKLKKLNIDLPVEWSQYGFKIDGAMSPARYVEYAASKISDAIGSAWKNRKPGGISYGVAHAFVGQNRPTAYFDGHSRMYGATNDFEFSHLEGYEDHSINLLYTWDKEKVLTGVMVNVAVPAQVGGSGSKLSADYWHETRLELRKQFGKNLYVFPQISAAGDLSPKILIDHRAEARMQKITGRTQREQIGINIADAVTSIFPTMKDNISWTPVLKHKSAKIGLARRHISYDDIYTARGTWHKPQVETIPEAYERLSAEYKKLYQELEENPELKKKENWYKPITAAFWRFMRASDVLDRYKIERTDPSLMVDVHAVRIGEMVIATNPFELYIDFGMQMKARSKAIQTFVVQLAGRGTYLPTQRAVDGGDYGAIPQSNLVGPEGGRQLVNQTLALIESLWDEDEMSNQKKNSN